ncbi:MAG: hypothetical protein OHK0039_30930 [Bacteroidia bacterium]
MTRYLVRIWALWLVWQVQPATAQPLLPAERLYLHCDRSLLLAGETLRGSLVCLTDDTLRITDLSRVVYVEVFDAWEQVWAKGKFALQSGHAAWSLDLPGDARSGYYFVRAYTHYQRNGPPEGLCTLPLRVLNPRLGPAPVSPVPGASVCMQGGRWIAGLEARLAVSLPADYAGGLLLLHQADGLRVAHSEIADNALALLVAVPAAGQRYHLTAHAPTGDTLRLALPEPLAQGCMPQVSRLAGATRFVWSCRPSAAGGYSLWLQTAQFHQRALAPLQAGSASEGYVLPDAACPPGSNYLVWRSADGSMEGRLPFVVPPRGDNLVLTTDRSVYGPREAVQLHIAAPTDLQAVSVSVVQRHDGDTTGHLSPLLVAHPWLLPHLLAQGLVLAETQQHIGLLLLEAYLADRQVPAAAATLAALDWLPEIRGVSIGGVIEGPDRQRLAGRTCVVSVLGAEPRLHPVQSGADGRFYAALPGYYGSQSLWVGVLGEPDEQATVRISRDFSDQYPRLHAVPVLTTPVLVAQATQWYIDQQVAAQWGPARDSMPLPPLPPPSFPAPDFDIALDDFIALPSLREVFSELVPAVQVVEREGRTRLQVYDLGQDLAYTRPVVLLDGVVMQDIDLLLALPPTRLARVEVGHRSYHLGDEVWGGWIVLHSRGRDLGGLAAPARSAFVRYATLQQARPLSSQPQAAAHVPDFRHELYWHPARALVAGQGVVSCHTSDRCGVYDVVVRGYRPDGTPCTGTAQVVVSCPDTSP